MSTAELFILALGLSMDAFAVAICKGLTVKKANFGHYILTGLYFGGFQAFMPFLGYLLGVRFQSLIVSIDHWIAFILLSIIGINMICAAKNNEEEEMDPSFAFRVMIPLAVATSIDALAVGVTFAFLSVNIVPAVSFIGIITFILSGVGVRIGNIFGTKYKSKAELMGGAVLVLMGLKILLEHMGVLD